MVMKLPSRAHSVNGNRSAVVACRYELTREFFELGHHFLEMLDDSFLLGQRHVLSNSVGESGDGVGRCGERKGRILGFLGGESEVARQ